jgi:nucleoside-diphosphate-sugar epimerase
MTVKVLLTGDRGYIGSVLSEYLVRKKYEVIGVDTGYFEENFLIKPFQSYKYYNKDIRNIEASDLLGINIVIHLAAISNDPLGQLNENITDKINRDASIRLAELAKKNGVNKFIFFSSQSMYGISQVSDELDEYDSEKNPLTAYARTKYEAEQIINKLANDEFIVTSLRPSTVFGASPRLRTDIVYNNLISSAYLKNKIEIKSDGTPIRPVIHILDVCNAVNAVLCSSKTIVNKKAYNIGIKNGNYTIKLMAETIQNILKGSKVSFTGEHGSDSRTYAVSFKRIFSELNNFKPEWNLTRGGEELILFFKKINFNEENFNGKMTNRLNMLNYLIKNNNLNDEFFWK